MERLITGRISYLNSGVVPRAIIHVISTGKQDQAQDVQSSILHAGVSRHMRVFTTYLHAITSVVNVPVFRDA